MRLLKHFKAFPLLIDSFASSKASKIEIFFEIAIAKDAFAQTTFS